KAVSNKLAISKKAAAKKPVAPAKQPATKKINGPTAKNAQQKTVEKTSAEPKTISNHKAELKKALSKIKAKNKEDKKPEKTFVMPKTHTEKARKYEPEFVKSVLDQAPEEYSGPTMRYSDSELVEFRELISKKLETAKKELGYLQGLITRKDQLGGDEADNRYMTMEDGGLSMEREQLSQMASRQITFIDHLEKAMMRIENKTYGICRVTGKLIDKARLRAVPHATLSIEAKMGIAKTT
ncbi:MAG TPA: TraR/DksA C4-type zinc finger protein, partial [Chitinophagaceae bacterium]